jgi:hypothetical protein
MEDEEVVTSETVKSFIGKLVNTLASDELEKRRFQQIASVKAGLPARERVEQRATLREYGMTIARDFSGVNIVLTCAADLLAVSYTVWRIRGDKWLLSSTLKDMTVMGDLKAYLRDMTMLMLAVDLDDL